MREFRSLAVPLLLAAALTHAPRAYAKPVAYEIDPVHSRVQFTIRHIFTKVTGNFTKFQGQVIYDAEAPAASSTKVEIDANSINTMNERRDGHLKSPDFFDAAKFPTLAFASTKLIPGEAGKFKLEGTLTIHGVSKPVTLDAEYLGTGPGLDGEPRIGFEATTKVNRKDYGILWNKTLDQGGTLLGDDVLVTIQIEGMGPAPAEKEASKASK